MKYIFRGVTVFEYKPEEKYKKVILYNLFESNGHDRGMNAFEYCGFINEDYKLLSQFFDTVYRHISDEDVELKDIEVY